jgi:hypothetical protein
MMNEVIEANLFSIGLCATPCLRGLPQSHRGHKESWRDHINLVFTGTSFDFKKTLCNFVSSVSPWFTQSHRGHKESWRDHINLVLTGTSFDFKKTLCNSVSSMSPWFYHRATEGIKNHGEII